MIYVEAGIHEVDCIIDVVVHVAAFSQGVIWCSWDRARRRKGVRVGVEKLGIAAFLSFLDHLRHECVVDSDDVLVVLKSRKDGS